MSETITECSKYTLTQYFAGVDKGLWIQITPMEFTDHICLSPREAVNLANDLITWAVSTEE